MLTATERRDWRADCGAAAEKLSRTGVRWGGEHARADKGSGGKDQLSAQLHGISPYRTLHKLTSGSALHNMIRNALGITNNLTSPTLSRPKTSKAVAESSA